MNLKMAILPVSDGLVAVAVGGTSVWVAVGSEVFVAVGSDVFVAVGSVVLVAVGVGVHSGVTLYTTI